MHDLTETQAATLIDQGIAATSPDPLYVLRSIAASQPEMLVRVIEFSVAKSNGFANK